MTGGRAVILGKIGRNFAAGMSGGVAYVLDMKPELCNQDLVELEKLEDAGEQDEVKAIVERHLEYTGSPLAKRLLENWEETLQRFTKVIPRDYKAMMENIARFKAEGHSEDEARRLAFMENK
jgi:glutamate synthase (ferredoxin)